MEQLKDISKMSRKELIREVQYYASQLNDAEPLFCDWYILELAQALALKADEAFDAMVAAHNELEADIEAWAEAWAE